MRRIVSQRKTYLKKHGCCPDPPGACCISLRIERNTHHHARILIVAARRSARSSLVDARATVVVPRRTSAPFHGFTSGATHYIHHSRSPPRCPAGDGVTVRGLPFSCVGARSVTRRPSQTTRYPSHPFRLQNLGWQSDRRIAVPDTARCRRSCGIILSYGQTCLPISSLSRIPAGWGNSADITVLIAMRGDTLATSVLLAISNRLTSAPLQALRTADDS